MRRTRTVMLAVALSIALLGAPACQRMVEVQTGTRVVDTQGRVISENIRTVRVSADKAGKYRVVTVTQESKVASLYDEAQAAIASGDLKTAEKKLSQVLVVSTTYRKAKQQYDAIKAGKKVTPDNGSTAGGTKPGTKPPPSTQPTATPSGLLRWVPDTITGFSAAKAFVDPLSVTRDYRPASGTRAETLVVYAEQFRSAADAKKALQAQVKSRYPKNADTTTINGHDVYFGTDGRRFVVIGFTQGAVMVAAEASAEPDDLPGLKELLRGVVEQLP